MHLPKLELPTQLFPILAINFIGSFGFSLVIPLLAVLIADWGGNGFVYALLVATYPFFQLIGSPLLGNLSDTWGRRGVLLISQTGTLLAWAIFLIGLLVPATPLLNIDTYLVGNLVISLPLVIIMLARALDGLTGGNVALAQAYVADVSDESSRNRNYGLLTMSGNLGFVVGPSLGALLAVGPLGAVVPVLFALGLSVTTLALVWRLPKTVEKTTGDTKQPTHQQLSFWSKVKTLNPQVKTLLGLYLCIFVAFNIFYATFPLHTVTNLGWSQAYLGVYFSALSLLMIVVQGPVLSWASQRVTERRLIIFGLLGLAVAFWCLSSSSVPLLWLAAVLFAVGNGLMWPSLLSVLSKTAHKANQGLVQGLSSSVASAASIGGLLFGGALFASFQANVYLVSVTIFTTVAGLVTVTSLGLRHDSNKKRRGD